LIVLCSFFCTVNVNAQQKQGDSKQVSEQLAEQMAQRLSRQLPQQLSQLSQLSAKKSSQQSPAQSPPPVQPAPTERPKLRLPEDKPLGAAGPSRDRRRPLPADADFMVVQDRWRVGIPEDPRFRKGNIFNPFRQNVLKGDYPIIGNDKFLNLTIVSETNAEFRRVPVGQDISARNPGGFEFFGRGRQDQVSQSFIVTVDFFKGDASFKPVDWRFKVTGIANINYLQARENGITNIDVRRGIARQKNFTSIEEAFFEYRLGDTQKIFPFLRGKGSKSGRSPEFDTTSVRVGIQPFTSDFRGFIFSDANLGVRLFGNFASNRWQYNLAFFEMLEKDTNSGLNTINFSHTNFRNQKVYIANVFRQDTFVKGYTLQFSMHYSDDKATFKLDNNGFLVRPAPIGTIRPHRVKSGYLGVAGDGHFGRINVTHALYQAIGTDSFNPIANQRTRINAQMAAAEFSIDFDYIRYRIGTFYTSGDGNPTDGTARGFDAILDNPNFAGGRFSFWASQGIRLLNSGTALVEPKSIIPSFRSSKIQGQANFVNPGLALYNAGIDVDVTPKLRGFLNYNYIRFNHTETIEQVSLFRAGVRHEIGHDLGLGFIYRPMLNENIVLTGGVTGLRPGRGFTDIYTSNCDGTPQGCGASRPTLWSTFLNMRFVY
jgi:hypothetical protein